MAAKWPLDLLRNWTTNYFECWLSLLGLKDNSSMVIQHLLDEYMLRLAQSKLINYPFASSSWREICLGKVKEGCRRVWILLSLSFWGLGSFSWGHCEGGWQAGLFGSFLTVPVSQYCKGTCFGGSAGGQRSHKVATTWDTPFTSFQAFLNIL